MKKNIYLSNPCIFPLILILFVSVTLAYETKFEYTNNPLKSVNVIYDEPYVVLTGYNLTSYPLCYTNEADNCAESYQLPINYLIEQRYDNINPYSQTSFRLTPTISLPDALYFLYIAAKDRFDNPTLPTDMKSYFGFVVDTSAPTVLYYYPHNGEVYYESQVLLRVDFKDRDNYYGTINQFFQPMEEVYVDSYLINNKEYKKNFTLDEVSDLPDDNLNFSQRTVLNLTDGYKIVKFRGKDLAGNPTEEVTFTFTVDKYPTKIFLLNPPFGIANSEIIDFVVGTDEIAKCRYSYTPVGYQNIQDTALWFTDDPWYDETGMNRHIKQEIEPFFGVPIYIYCNDTRKRIVNNTFVLSLDTQAPTLELTANPLEVVEYTNGKLQTTLVAKTNKPSVCRWDTSEKTFNQMQHLFNGDETEFSSYKNISTTLISDLQNLGTYTFYVRCKSLNQLVSDIKSVQVIVNLAGELTLTVHSPKGYVRPEVIFNLTTNKYSVCRYGQQSPTNPFTSSNGYRHLATRQLVSGTYTYKFLCLDQSGKNKTAQTTFTVDNDNPAMEYVNTTLPGSDVVGVQPWTNKVYGRWLANDNTSGISYYRIVVIKDSSNEIVVNKTETAQEAYLTTSKTLSNKDKLTMKVKAYDKVNLVSDEKSDKITINTSYVPPASPCENNRRDGTESDVDCGGSCKKCDVGYRCNFDSDCVTNVCDPTSHICIYPPPTCFDNVLNGFETDVDCGGLCPPCANNKECERDADCVSHLCVNGVCVTPPQHCTNNKKDGNETDVDCGGDCPPCQEGKDCDENDDCISEICQNGKCVDVGDHCQNSKLDDAETDIDCGGPKCLDCDEGQSCRWDDDCSSKNCDPLLLICTQPPDTCSDEIENGDETDLDCGGSCYGCANGKDCKVDSDCLSHFCKNNKCASPPSHCTNGKKDPSESDIDCGLDCPACFSGYKCFNNSDCITNLCVNGRCSYPTACNNNILDGDEVDVDCGGSCGKCGIGKRCIINSDCISGYCNFITKECEEPGLCNNMKKDENETDVDCGGSCGPCETGQKCIIDADCISRICKNETCQPIPPDDDKDGIINDIDNCPGTPPECKVDENGCPFDFDKDAICDELDPDDDNDGMSDSYEQQYSLNYHDASDAPLDYDNDKLTNLEESKHNTNPNKKDTDGDGWSDYIELKKGTNPLDPLDHPTSGLWIWLLIILLILLAAGGYYFYKKFYKEKKKELAKEKPKLKKFKPLEEGEPQKPKPPVFFEPKPLEKVVEKPEEKKPSQKRLELEELFKDFGTKLPELKKMTKEELEKTLTTKTPQEKVEFLELISLALANKKYGKFALTQKDIFDQLTKIQKQERQKDVFAEVRELARKKGDISHIKELEALAKKKELREKEQKEKQDKSQKKPRTREMEKLEQITKERSKAKTSAIKELETITSREKKTQKPELKGLEEIAKRKKSAKK